MKYRFKIYEVSRDGSTGLVCGRTPILITDFSQLNFILNLDGIELFSGEFLVGGVNPSIYTNTSNVNGVNVILTVADTGQITIEIPTESYDEAHRLLLNIVKVDGTMNTYTNTINIYGYDLGNDANSTNNLGLSVRSNPNMNIVLVDSLALDTYSKFIGYNIPLTSNMELVELSSGEGITYYQAASNDEVIGLGNATTAGIQDGNYYSRKVRTANNLECRDYQELKLFKYCPNINLSIIHPRNIQNTCFSITGKKIRANLDVATFTQIFIDDVASTLFNTPKFVYTLRNRLSEVVQVETFELNFNNLFTSSGIIGVADISTQIDWELPQLNIDETYTVEGQLISNCQFTCINTINLPICFESDITKIECNNYAIFNANPVVITVTINKWNNSEFVEQSVHLLLEDETKTLELEDGVYSVQFRHSEDFYNKIVLVDCGIKTCITDIIETFIYKITDVNCDCTLDCTCNTSSFIGDKELFDVNMINIQYLQYLNLVNSLSIINPIFTTLTTDLTEAIINIDNLLNAFKLYCQNCE